MDKEGGFWAEIRTKWNEPKKIVIKNFGAQNSANRALKANIVNHKGGSTAPDSSEL